MRWRIKFTLLGVAVLFVVRIYTSTQALLFRGVGPASLELLKTPAPLVPSATLLMAALCFSGPAISRSTFTRRNRSSRARSRCCWRAFTWCSWGLWPSWPRSSEATASSHRRRLWYSSRSWCWPFCLQSDRARLMLRQYLSRNFQRPLYDYRKVWMNFTAASASRVEQADLCRSLVRLTADMFQALSVAIWVVDEKKEYLALAASTFLSESKAPRLGPRKARGQRPIDASPGGSSAPNRWTLRQTRPPGPSA